MFMADDGKYSASVNVHIGVQKTYNRRPEFSGNYDIKSIVANRNYNESLFQVGDVIIGNCHLETNLFSCTCSNIHETSKTYLINLLLVILFFFYYGILF